MITAQTIVIIYLSAMFIVGLIRPTLVPRKYAHIDGDWWAAQVGATIFWPIWVMFLLPGLLGERIPNFLGVFKR